MTQALTLHIDDGGEGALTPVLFVHSLGGRASHWTEQLRHLRATRRAIAFDLHGHGDSDAGEGAGYSVPAFAADVAAVADQLGLQRFVLVGHSLGGAAGIAYAGEHADRVAGLFLLDPAADGRAVPPGQVEGIRAAIERDGYEATMGGYWASLLGPSTEAVRERVVAEMLATAQAVIRDSMASLLQFDPLTPLAAYGGPKLSVFTLFNQSPPALHLRDPSLPHREVEGVSHWLQLDRPQVVNDLLDEFLQSVPS